MRKRGCKKGERERGRGRIGEKEEERGKCKEGVRKG